MANLKDLYNSINLVAEKSVRIFIHKEWDMLEDNICRMFLTNDMSELNHMYDAVKEEIDIIYEYHSIRVKKLQNINGGVDRCGQ